MTNASMAVQTLERLWCTTLGPGEPSVSDQYDQMSYISLLWTMLSMVNVSFIVDARSSGITDGHVCAHHLHLHGHQGKAKGTMTVALAMLWPMWHAKQFFSAPPPISPTKHQDLPLASACATSVHSTADTCDSKLWDSQRVSNGLQSPVIRLVSERCR